MTNIIEIKNLSFSYNKDNIIFNNLSLNIKKGKITTILGKNGCGKSKETSSQFFVPSATVLKAVEVVEFD